MLLAPPSVQLPQLKDALDPDPKRAAVLPCGRFRDQLNVLQPQLQVALVVAQHLHSM